MTERGTITITLEGLSIQEVERYRQIIQTLILEGALNIRNGKALLHFNHLGDLQQIQLDVIKWRRDASVNPIAKNLKNVTVEITQ